MKVINFWAWDERNQNEGKESYLIANARILCSCGQKHWLIPAIDAPAYWCGSELVNLKIGDDVEIEEEKKESE